MIPHFSLYPYQQTGVDFILNHPHMILADSVGLGKTVQAVAAVAQSGTQRVLVAAPNAVLEQWQDTFKRFVGLEAVIYEGAPTDRKSLLDAPILLAPYAKLIRDYAHMPAYDFVIADESTAFKSFGQTARALYALTENATRTLGLSATPITNSIVDVWAQHAVLRIPSFECTIHEFYDQYCIRKRVAVSRSRKVWQTVGFKNLDRFKQVVIPYHLRRTLSEVQLDLPEVHYAPQYVELTEAHRAAYRAQLDRSPNSMLLQQLLEVDATGREKVDTALDIIQYDPTEKTIIYAFFKRTIAALEQRLGAAGIGYVSVTGDTGDQRGQLIERFKTSLECKVLITNTLTHGVNLQVASRVILITMIANPATLKQIIGRVHRIGSDHSRVMIIPLLCPKTHETQWYKRLQQREQITMYVEDRPSTLFPKLSVIEIDEIRNL